MIHTFVGSRPRFQNSKHACSKTQRSAILDNYYGKKKIDLPNEYSARFSTVRTVQTLVVRLFCRHCSYAVEIVRKNEQNNIILSLPFENSVPITLNCPTYDQNLFLYILGFFFSRKYQLLVIISIGGDLVKYLGGLQQKMKYFGGTSNLRLRL